MRQVHSFPTRRSSDLKMPSRIVGWAAVLLSLPLWGDDWTGLGRDDARTRAASEILTSPAPLGSPVARSEEHTSELQSPDHLVCRLLLEKKNTRHKHRD